MPKSTCCLRLEHANNYQYKPPQLEPGY
jgi:hypothetical protein